MIGRDRWYILERNPIREDFGYIIHGKIKLLLVTMYYVMKIRHFNGIMNPKIKMEMEQVHLRSCGVMVKQPKIMVVRSQLQQKPNNSLIQPKPR